MISRYDAYKDSGVEWIGEIPEHWEISRFKYDSTSPVKYGLNISSDSYKEKGIRFIRITDIAESGVLICENGVFLEKKDVPKEFLLKKNDVLFCRSGHTVGKSYLHSEDGEFTSGGYLVRFNFQNSVEARFIFLLGKTNFYWDWIKLNTVVSTIENVNGDKFQNFQYAKPPISEQTQIVSYLDEKTALIDKLISVKQRKIELLKEKRTALINQAVTKGLNSNVKMKDSGIEWIGEIPEHWGYKKTTHCFGLIGSGTTPTSNNSEYYEDGKINWLQTGDLTDGIITKTSKLITQKAFDDVNLKLYPANSLIIAMYGATIGKVGLLKIETTTNQACCVLAQPRGVFVNYIFYWFIANKDKIVSLAYGGGQPNISQETIKSIRIHCPPISEQAQIVTYLDEKTKEIDDLLNLEQKKIDLLKEYRQSLISEVVTGKIKVVNELLNEFDED